MIALRKGQSKVNHESYVEAIAEVQAKKKDTYVPYQFFPYIHEVLTIAGSISTHSSAKTRVLALFMKSLVA